MQYHPFTNGTHYGINLDMVPPLCQIVSNEGMSIEMVVIGCWMLSLQALLGGHSIRGHAATILW